jgi:hypothetical protein
LRACSIKPEDRRTQLKLVGNDLIKNYGKKKYYSVMEVKNANKRQGVSLDVGCWSHAFFNSHGDFDDFHRKMGEECDYVALKSEMLTSLSLPVESSSLFDIDLSWLELPNVDFSVFDFFD